MTPTNRPKSVFSSSARLLVPAVALALGVGFASPAQASPAGQSALQAKLNEFGTETNTTAKTILTAPADQLALAIFEVLQENASFTAADIVSSALEIVGTKARADKDKIVGRLLNAGILGDDIQDEPAAIASTLTAVLSVNSSQTAKLQLTAAGKALATAQALKSADPSVSAGDEIADAVNLATGTVGTTDTTAQAFMLATLKNVGTSVDQVKAFVDRVLTAKVGNDTLVATNVAAGIAAKQPAAAGEVFGGLSVGMTDDTIQTTIGTAVLNPKLAKAISDIVASSGKELDTKTTAQFVGGLVTTTTKIANRGAIAGGGLRAADAGESTADIIAASGLTISPTAKDAVAFATAAAVGNGMTDGIGNSRAAELADNLASRFNDALSKTQVGTAVIKSIAVTNPSAARLVAFNLADGATAFDGVAAQSKLAADLAKAVSTNGAAAGAAVAGVIDEANSALADQYTITAGAIKVATKAATGIAQQVSALSEVTDKKAFAVGLVAIDTATNKARVAATLAGNVAAGVALTDTANTGAIAAAVSSENVGTQAQTLKIASTVATAVDIERIADVGQKITALFNVVVPAGSKLPKISSVSALALSLAKAINTKPVTTSLEFNSVQTTNRVDELGELAAAIVSEAIKKTTDQKIIASIGTSIIKALSTKLLPNGQSYAADFKDAVKDIAGAIAQTISVATSPAGLTGTAANDAKTALLASNSVLVSTLTKAAKTFGVDVTAAFDEVRLAGLGVLVPRAAGQAATDLSAGKYETGWVIDPETPSKNI